MKKLNVKLHFTNEKSFSAGELYLSQKDGRYHFNYDPSFTGYMYDISPLLLKKDYTSHVALHNPDFYDLHGVFADSLPDDWGRKVQDAEFYKLGIDDPTAIDRLAFIGNYGIGALRYEPAQEFSQGDSIVTLADLRKATQQIIEGTCDDVSDALLRSGGSAGGMRPKFCVDIDSNDHTNLRYSTGKIEDNFLPVILKVPQKNGDQFQRIEYIYSKIAKSCGINIPETFLLTGNRSKSAFFAIRRFDILDSNERVHVHSYAGLHGLNFREVSHDYTDLLRTTQNLTNDHNQVVECYRKMVFNYLGYNNDDHLKNFSYIMDSDGKWSLSPSYDASYSTGKQGFHAMSINGIRQNAQLSDFEKVAAIFNIKDWLKIVIKTCESFTTFPDLANQVRLDKKRTDIVFNRIKECVKRVKKI